MTQAGDLGLEELSLNQDQNIPPAKDSTKFYDSIASKYDSLNDLEETVLLIGRKREWLMSQIEGDVLEVACGTGRNIRHLDIGKINSITFLDASSKMLEVTRGKFERQYRDFQNVTYVAAKAESLAETMSSHRYDTIIETFGLCSQEDPIGALQSMAKLLKEKGKIVLLEHGRANYGLINTFVDKKALKHSENWGCRWNLDIGDLVTKSGLNILTIQRHNLGLTWCIIAENYSKTRISEVRRS